MPAAPVLSRDFAKASLASETEEVIVFLVEFGHPSLAEPIRLCSDMAEIYGYDEESGDPVYVTRHQGRPYFYAPFSYIPPGSPDEDSMPQARFVIANVDTRIIQAIRDIHSRLTVKTRVVYASDPDEIVSDIPLLWVEEVDYNAATITATLGFKHFLGELLPSRTFVPADFPALYKSVVSRVSS